MRVSVIINFFSLGFEVEHMARSEGKSCWSASLCNVLYMVDVSPHVIYL